MTATLLATVDNQVRDIWSDIFMDELMQSTILASLVNKDYQGELRERGDVVKVSQINRPTATRKATGSGHEYFETTALSTTQISITANQTIAAAYEFDSLVQLQSQIGDQNSKIRQGLVEAYAIALNDYLYSVVSPSTSAPDHSVASVSDFNAAALIANRKLASAARWSNNGGWWALLDASYYGDLLAAQTMTSNEYAPDAPVVGGKFATQRFGFNILEDNSAGLLTLGTSGADCALLFHPDFMHLVHSLTPEFEVSSLHSNKQFGYAISVKGVCGAALGIDGDVKHIVNYNT